MDSLRGSIASIPSAVTNFIASNYLPSHHSRSSTSTAITDDDDDFSIISSHHYKSLPIPASLVKEQWRLIFTSDANAKDLEEAIAHCRDLVLCSDECSEERRWLVRHLIDLRYSLKELQEAELIHANGVCHPTVKSVVGHHFVIYQRGSIDCGGGASVFGRLHDTGMRNYCDHCTGIIWSVVQTPYICRDCYFVAHPKCVDSVVRICAHVIVSERAYPTKDICPEIGLAAQGYKCAECETLLNFDPSSNVRCFGRSTHKASSWIEPRLCDYSGLYYCPNCHWNDSSIIPARVVHNWDFARRKVSRASLQEIYLFLDRPVIKLEEANPKLFVFLEKLCLLKKLRQNLIYMRKYLMECRQAAEEKLLDTKTATRRHLIQSNEFYSINDLEETESGVLYEFLQKVFNSFDGHIRNCSLCMAKAYICEICSNNEVIFPFDDGCILCEKCNSIYHRVCMTRKNMVCPKCARLEKRKMKLESNNDNGDGNNDDDDDNDD